MGNVKKVKKSAHIGEHTERAGGLGREYVRTRRHMRFIVDRGGPNKGLAYYTTIRGARAAVMGIEAIIKNELTLRAEYTEWKRGA